MVVTHLQALKFELQEEVCCSQVVAQTTSEETERLRLTRCCCSEDSSRVVRCSCASPSAARARGGPAALAALACVSGWVGEDKWQSIQAAADQLLTFPASPAPPCYEGAPRSTGSPRPAPPFAQDQNHFKVRKFTWRHSGPTTRETMIDRVGGCRLNAL